eukprot:7649870-Lingulodinium_polyedra.AAC.1
MRRRAGNAKPHASQAAPAGGSTAAWGQAQDPAESACQSPCCQPWPDQVPCSQRCEPEAGCA